MSLTPAAPPGSADGPIRAPLIALTGVTGVIDAASFLGMGHIFTANMTGNVVFLGFALAGSPGLSVARCSMALAGFIAGAAMGGRLMAGVTAATRLSRIGLAWTAEAAVLAAASIMAAASPKGAGDPSIAGFVIVITAVAMGLRNATVRALAVPDLTTTVLTLTITGLAADSRLVGGNNPRWPRRVASVAALGAGAALGAALLRHGLAWPLLFGAIVDGACVVVIRLQDRARVAAT